MSERVHVRDGRVAVLARQLHRAEGVEPAGGGALRQAHLRRRPHRALHGAGHGLALLQPPDGLQGHLHLPIQGTIQLTRMTGSNFLRAPQYSYPKTVQKTPGQPNASACIANPWIKCD